MSTGKSAAFGSDEIDEDRVAAMGRAAGFSFGNEELPSIAAQLRRACEIAAPLLAFEPEAEDELGPVWRP